MLANFFILQINRCTWLYLSNNGSSGKADIEVLAGWLMKYTIPVIFKVSGIAVTQQSLQYSNLGSVLSDYYTFAFCFAVWDVCTVYLISLLLVILQYSDSKAIFTNDKLVSQCHAGTLSHGHCKYLGCVSRLQDCGTKLVFFNNESSEFTILGRFSWNTNLDGFVFSESLFTSTLQRKFFPSP